jgi:hypothetical protein
MAISYHARCGRFIGAVADVAFKHMHDEQLIVLHTQNSLTALDAGWIIG